ncbi:hypothetical protein DCC85_14960 [Paenibacillus sp. CAA11]|uniref:hypothetical protein n=1 Tax=Paenibacillus sp. CAA11 TaxID=1532905 RepID=UPI000D3CA5DA|nr:hypothetical protein [Paenibacillus sp. CAA11]AWB45391.1 hypothetical protein DCC85_14960 [Paenibacillus sp. CAA11]
MSDEQKPDLSEPKKPIQRVDYPRKTDHEEYAAEIAPSNRTTNVRPLDRRVIVDKSVVPIRKYSDRTDKSSAQTAAGEKDAGKTAGYIGVGLGVLSLFMWSIVLGPIAAVLGFYAYNQGKRTSGAWALTLGIISTISYFVLIPFTR